MKRILSFIFVLCIAFGVFSTSVFAFDMTLGGLDFDYIVHRSGASDKYYAEDYYQSVKKLDEVPHTFEAWINASLSLWQDGVILGNDSARAGGRFRFAINKDFCPELTFKNKNGAVHSAVFTEVTMASNQWAHLVIVFDETAKAFRCYVNGELKQTIAFADTCQDKCKDGCIGIFSVESASQYSFLLGGDLNYLNPNFFRGYIRDVALYGDVLTDEEIKADSERGVNADDEAIILYYDIDYLDKGKDIEDLSGNGYHLTYSKLWLTEAEMQAEREKKGFVGEYDYAVAVIGDPQYATKSNPEAVRAAYSWLAENKESKNIQYVIGVGDITDQCQEKEWLEAAEALKILEDAGLYYSLVRGNHDVATVSGIDESSKATAKPEMFDELFAADGGFYISQFAENGGLYEEGSVKNTYKALDFCGNKWLVLNLDYSVDTAVLEWAKGVIESHPEHRVIIVTHDYIGATTNLTSNGNKIWDNLAGQYENVVLVLAGHVSWDNIEVRQSEGVHGNTVTQMLINPQRIDLLLSGVGIVTMFYFSDNGSLVDVEHYSPEWDRYFKNINQMQIDLESDRFKDTVIKAPVIDETPITTPDPIPESNNKMWIAISVSAAVILGSAVSVPLLIKKSRKRRVKKLFESEEQ